MSNDGSESDTNLYARFDRRYVQNGSTKRRTLTEVPVIDFSHFVSGAIGRAGVARQIRSACVDLGFFYLVEHGISQEELGEAFTWGHRFFALPLYEKMKTHTSNSSERQGYIRTGGVSPKTDADETADLKERFGMGRELIVGEPATGRYSAGRSQWPDPTVLPGFEDFMKRHLQKRLLLSKQLVRAFALALELPEGYFDDPFHYPGCSLFFNYYPPLDLATLARKRWSFTPHTDYGAFTLLSQDNLGGLQVRNFAGDWIDVSPIEGSFVVNVGDMLAMWTNDLFASNLHRVVNTSGQARLSSSFFFHPHGSTTINCLPSCQRAENPPRYQPVQAEDYMRGLVAQMNETGRPGLSAHTAERLNA